MEIRYFDLYYTTTALRLANIEEQLLLQFTTNNLFRVPIKAKFKTVSKYTKAKSDGKKESGPAPP